MINENSPDSMESEERLKTMYFIQRYSDEIFCFGHFDLVIRPLVIIK